MFWLVLVACVIVILLALRYVMPWWEEKCKRWGDRAVRYIRRNDD